MISEGGEGAVNNLPTYNELLHILHLKTMSYSTTRRWLKYLGFNYDENKRSYYTDEHEREDVVIDRNERFLVKYCEFELRTYRWVQINSDT